MRTRSSGSGDPDRISAGQLGAMTVAIPAAGRAGGQEIRMRDRTEARTAPARLTV